MEEEQKMKLTAATHFGQIKSENTAAIVSQTNQQQVPDMEIEDEDPLSYLRDAAPQYGANANDLAETLRKQRAHPVLKSKLRKVPMAVMNRRHRKLRELIDEGDYFSEEEVRRRAPLLYQLYVGRYKRYSPDPDSTTGDELSRLLLNQLTKTQAAEELQAALQREPQSWKELENTETELSEEQLSDNIDELLILMHQRFLSGEDKEFFDYTTIDGELDGENDPDPLYERDLEEAYYDEPEDEPKTLGSQYTGIQDY